MPKICYEKIRFSAASLAVINRANEILEDYTDQGYDLTLRQLYYQFVSRGFIPNKDTEYKKLGSIVNDARLAGLIDWDHITDRTRNLRENAHWTSPQEIIDACARQFQHDKWKDQKNYVEVWVEKDALVGVLEVACKPLDVPYFSCRGYTSQSEMWAAGQRLLGHVKVGQKVTIIHMGDHDPSGVDMSRDIGDRIRKFIQHHLIVDYARAHDQRKGESEDAYIDRLNDGFHGSEADAESNFTLNRIALNMDQIREYNPPPNPAKFTDARANKYVEEYGDESWELDALEPAVITELIRQAVFDVRNDDVWESAVRKEEAEKLQISLVAKNWSKVVKGLK